MQDFLLISDPAVLAVPVEDNGDPLVDVRDALPVDSLKDDGSGNFAMLRSGLVERLSGLEFPDGISLRIVEGFRPLSLQASYFSEYVEELRSTHPHWDEGRLRVEASKYVAPPDIIPPHSTGGAVDLMLTDASGTPLEMGTRINADPVESGGACFTHSPDISDAARENRRLLCSTLEKAGLVNYPTEWWHWSWGDRYWAYHVRSPEACYGAV